MPKFPDGGQTLPDRGALALLKPPLDMGNINVYNKIVIKIQNGRKYVHQRIFFTEISG